MRVMVDTNIIISAILKEGSLPDMVLNEICENHELILCDYIISESYDVAKRRFPMKIQVLDKLFAKLRYELVPAPRFGEIQMRDVNLIFIVHNCLRHLQTLYFALVRCSGNRFEISVYYHPRFCS